MPRIFDNPELGTSLLPALRVGAGQLNEDQRLRLSALLPELEQAMSANLVFKLNAGKNIGNYNLAKCRHITDKIERYGWKLWA